MATARFKQEEMAKGPTLRQKGTEWAEPSSDLLADEHPSWAEIVGREISKVKGRAARPGAENSWGLDQDALQAKPSKRKPAPGMPDNWNFDSPLPYAQLGKKSRTGPIQWMRGALQHRRVSQAIAAVVLILFISSLNVPWNSLFEEQVEAMRAAIIAGINSVSQPIEERATFFIVDNFSDGVENWLSRSGSEIDRQDARLMASGDMFLWNDTLHFSSYHMDFNAKI